MISDEDYLNEEIIKLLIYGAFLNEPVNKDDYLYMKKTYQRILFPQN